MEDKEKQIEETAKLDIEESAGFYSAFINDRRISKNKPLGISKTIMSFYCPKNYILQAIGISEDSVVLTKEEQDKILKATEKRIELLKEENGQLRLENNDIEAENEKLKNYNDKLSQGIYYGNGEQFCNRLEQVRKETAREIIYKIKETLIVNNEENTEFFDYCYTLETIDEIAKQYGVGVENER